MLKRSLLFVLLCGVGPVAFAQLPPIPDEPGADAGSRPRLFVGQRTLELGTVHEGDIVPIRWLLENQGAGDLIIESTKAGCGCTVVKLREEEKVIPPGGSLALKAEFNSTGRRGRQTKNVTVHSNDPAEPTLKLRFLAQVEPLYNMMPATVVNLRNVQRGAVASRSLEITPGPNRTTLEILEVRIRGAELLQAAVEPFQSGATTPGQRIRFTVAQEAPLGTLMTSARIRLKIDGLERERTVQVRGEVVGDLTWLPKVVDATRQRSTRGKRLAPVTIRSTDKMPFDVLGADAGPLLDVRLEPVEKAPPRTQYTLHMTVRQDAPSGPFGTTLKVRTTAVDQPLIRIPVFGIVAAPITVDPPLVLLRQDGTRVGMERRVKLQTSPRLKLDVSEVRCPLGALSVELHEHPSGRRPHIRFLEVRLAGKLPKGTHETVITLKTGIEGAETLTIPVTVEVPGA